jgi:hypothetical protein
MDSMALWGRLFGSKAERAASGKQTHSGNDSGKAILDGRQILACPDWFPPDPAAQRLVAFGKRVAGELRRRGIPTSREGGNHWVVSYDVAEAVWWVAEPGSWADKHGLIRDGWSQGHCLLLFTNGVLGQGSWVGEVDPKGTSVKIDDVEPLSIPSHRWAGGNLGRWRSGTGGLNPKAQEHFKGFWPGPREPLSPWAGTSSALKRFLTEGGSQLPRYY